MALPGNSTALPSFTLSAAARRGIAAGCELALAAHLLLFLPLTTIAPLGIAALASTAGICALGLLLARGGTDLRPLATPALIVALLLACGALSALWSIEPLRSLEMAGRMAGLAAAGFCLMAAAPRIARPRRLLLCGLIGIGLGGAVAAGELATGGVLHNLLFQRGYLPVKLNRASIALAILVLPTVATLICLRRPLVAAPLGAAMIAMIYLLVATSAKFLVPIGTAAAALTLLSRRVLPVAAALSVMIVLTAPYTFGQLAGVPGMIERADQIKDSAAHRLAIWQFAGERIAERPLLGWGLDASRAMPGGQALFRPWQKLLPLHPHNGALQVRLELGLPGIAILAWLVGWLWLALSRADYPPLFRAAAAGSLAAALIVGLGDNDFWHEWWVGSVWMMLFFVNVMGSLCRQAAAANGADNPGRRPFRWRADRADRRGDLP